MINGESKSLNVNSPKIIAVGGGKGGVGKSFVSVNLALTIADRAYRTIVVDLDFGGANIAMLLGVYNIVNIDNFFKAKGNDRSLEKLVTPTKYPNLWIIQGSSGLLSVANPNFQQKRLLSKYICALDADVVILDLGAGTHFDVLDLFALSQDSGLIVTTIEKTSLDNAVKFIWAMCSRQIIRHYKSPIIDSLMAETRDIEDLYIKIDNTPYLLDEQKNDLKEKIAALSASYKPKLIINRVPSSLSAMRSAASLTGYVKKKLKGDLGYLGCILEDPAASESIDAQEPIVARYPKCEATKCFHGIASKLGFV